MNNKTKVIETQLNTLKIIDNNPDWNQRQVARELGISIGKTNYIIRALISRGLIKAKNFKRSDNKKSYIYLLTSQGIMEKYKLTENFLKIKSNEYNKLKKEIQALKSEL